MLAEVPERVVDIGTWAGVVTAVVAALRTPPGRLLWRRLVARPVGEWLDGKHAEALAPVREELADHGRELVAQSRRLREHLTTEEAAAVRQEELNERIVDRLDGNEKRMGRIEAKQDELAGHVMEALAGLAGGNPEVRPSLRLPGPSNVWGGR